MDCYENWIVCSGIAFPQGVEKGYLAEVYNTTTTLLYATLISSVAARCLELLEDAGL